MKTYELETKHNGKTQVHRISAASIGEAQEIACKNEAAPLSAMTWWRIVPTARQAARTKSLMRGL